MLNPYTAYPQPMVQPVAYHPQSQMAYAQQMMPMQPQHSQAPPSPTLQPQQPGMQVRMVSSIDEARATIIDPGTSHLFIDNANRRIYGKYLNADGSAVLQVYALQETPEPVQTGYASKAELDQVQQQLISLQTQFAAALQQLAPLFEGGEK